MRMGDYYQLMLEAWLEDMEMLNGLEFDARDGLEFGAGDVDRGLDNLKSSGRNTYCDL